MKIFLLILILFFGSTLTAQASSVYIVAPKDINNDKPFSVSVEIDTENVSINSFDIAIVYPRDLVSFSGYKEDGSIKKIWITQPTEIDGTIHLSGIIPGGVDGMYDPDKVGLQPIPIINLLFSAKNSGKGLFGIINSEILKNDGIGSPLIHENRDASFVVPNSIVFLSNNEYYKSDDVEPPLPIQVEYIPAGIFSKTPSMIWFSTTDIGTGVKKYQLRIRGGSWKDITSPFPIQKAIFKRDLVIRAVDFNDNVRETKIEEPGLLSMNQVFLILFLSLCCYSLFFMVKRKR